jgi:hypothetical protein
LDVFDITLERLESFLPYAHLVPLVAKLFQILFHRIQEGIEWKQQRAAILYEILSRYFTDLGTSAFVYLEGVVEFSLALLPFPECGMTEWFLNWIIALYEQSDFSEICATELLRFLVCLLARTAAPSDFHLTGFLEHVFHSAGWQSKLRAMVYQVLFMLVTHIPEFVGPLVMEEPLEQMTPYRALCIFALVGSNNLDVPGDELISWLPYLECIEQKLVERTLFVIQCCQSVVNSPELRLHVTRLQCKFVMMLHRAAVRGHPPVPHIRPETIQRVIQTICQRKAADPTSFELLSQMWEGDERRWTSFVQSLPG